MFSDHSFKQTCSRSACFSKFSNSSSPSLYFFKNNFTFESLYFIGDQGKFNFLPTTVYVYRHSISIQTTFDKSKNTASIAEFNFNVHVNIKDCDGTMFVSFLLFFEKKKKTPPTISKKLFRVSRSPIQGWKKESKPETRIPPPSTRKIFWIRTTKNSTKSCKRTC